MLELKNKKNIHLDNFKLNDFHNYKNSVKFTKHLVIEGKDENGDAIYFINTSNPRILDLKKEPDFFFLKNQFLTKKTHIYWLHKM